MAKKGKKARLNDIILQENCPKTRCCISSAQIIFLYFAFLGMVSFVRKIHPLNSSLFIHAYVFIDVIAWTILDFLVDLTYVFTDNSECYEQTSRAEPYGNHE